MTVRHGEYEMDDARERFDVARVFEWLAATYWSLDLTPGQFRRAVNGSSLVVGAYQDGAQVGCLRVVSDRATFAWVADVFVAEPHRRRAWPGDGPLRPPPPGPPGPAPLDARDPRRPRRLPSPASRLCPTRTQMMIYRPGPTWPRGPFSSRKGTGRLRPG